MLTHNLSSNNGWILPNGDFYSCERDEHSTTADEIFNTILNLIPNRDPSILAEEQGWVKIAQAIDKINSLYILCLFKLKQPQIDTLFDWCILHKTKFPSIDDYSTKTINKPEIEILV